MNHRHLEPITDRNTPREKATRYRLKAAAREAGYRLLSECYTAENNPEGWKRYESYIADMLAGRTKSPFPIDELPKSVKVRQTQAAADPWAPKESKP